MTCQLPAGSRSGVGASHGHHGNAADTLPCPSLVFAGGGLPRGHGEALPAAHLPPQPPLAVETPGHHEEETAVLVSRLSKATITPVSLSPLPGP